MGLWICQVQRVGKLFLLFTAVPLLELYLLGKLAQYMGLGTTIALVLVTGVLGASLARVQGRQVLRDWQASLARGEVPQSGVTDALLVVVGGVLLITPGVLTDAVGLSLLLPPPRRLIGRMLVAYFRRKIEAGHIHMARAGGSPPMGFPHGGIDPFGPSGVQPFGAPDEGPREVIRVEAKVRDVPPDDDAS